MAKENHQHDPQICFNDPGQKTGQCLRIDQIYRQIKSLDDFAPSPRVNYLFSSLVSHALNPNVIHSLTISEVDDLQRICSLAEFQLESYWAQKIITSNYPRDTIKGFTYYKNYQKLTALEFEKIMECTSQLGSQRWLFIGGGPLPLTAIILAQDFGVNITIIDTDKTAVTKALAVINILKLSDKIEIKQSAGENYQNYAQHPVVFVAALAGADDIVKQNIFEQIYQHSRPNTYILARSSYGNRRLLYKPVSFDSMVGFEKVLEFHPVDEVVNSILIAKKSIIA